MKFATAILAACGLATSGLTLPALADSTPSLGDQFRQHSDRQQEVRVQTGGVGEQIDAVVAEFERNGLGNGKDVATLKSLRSVLGQLNQDQMQRVVELLQHAAASPSGNLADATQAFTVQQDILAQFRKLLVEYQRQQGMASLAQRLEQLAARQSTNLRAAVDLATTPVPNSNKPDNRKNTAALAAMLQQQTEQSDIAGEVADALATAKLMMNDASGDEATRLAKALADPAAKSATDQSKTAATDLQTGNLYRAASGEKTSRDSLRSLAEMLAPPKSALDVKKEQLAALDAVQQKQQDLMQQTLTKPEHPDPHDPAASMQPLARQQAAAVDETEDAKQKLANLSPKTAAALNQAEQDMQQARGDLQNQSRKTAAADEAKASNDLDAARKQLQDEIAKSDPQSPDNAAAAAADPEAAAKQLAEQIKQLRQQQKSAAADTHANPASAHQQAEQQQQLASDAQNLQQQAADTSKQAADALGQANQQMQQAGEYLRRSKPDAAAQKQQSADDALARAQSAAEQQAQDMAQAKQDVNDLQKAQQQIGQLMQKQAQLATSTPDASQQKDLAGKTEDTPAALPASAKAAAAPLQDAAAQMKNASGDMQKTQNADARADQAKAMAHLADAAAKVNTAMEQAQAKLGQQPGEDAAAQAALDKAAGELQQAQAELKKPDGAGQSQAAAQHLQSAAKAAAQALADNKDAQQKGAVQQALDQMAKAADANEQKNNADAKQDAQQAAQALADAKLAMPQMNQQANAQQTPPQQQKSPESDLTGNQASPDGERAAQDGGPRNAVASGNSFVQLPARDRDALQQSQGEKYPQEYGPLVEQYLKNLSDTPSK